MFTFLRRTPLRIKLVAAILALVAAALTVIGVSATYAMDRYLKNQVDLQLTQYMQGITIVPSGVSAPGALPPNWLLALMTTTGAGSKAYGSEVRSPSDLPAFLDTVAKVQAHNKKPYTVKSVDGRVTWRILALSAPNNGEVVYVGETLTSVQNSVRRLVIIELSVGGIVLIVLGSLGAGLVRASLRPLVEIEQTAAAIAAGDLTRRVPDFEPPDGEPQTEVGRLGQAFNSMIGQIEASFEARTASETAARESAETAQAAAEAAQRSEARAVRSEQKMRRFAADASHELRTPLTTIRGFAELYRQGAASSPEQAARIIRRIEDEAARMGLLVEDLLLLARLDQERPLETLPVDLRVIGSDSVVNAQAIAPSRQIDLDIEAGAGSLVVIGDELRLRQVVTNLMTNALTYTPVEAPIVIRLGRSARDGFVEIAVVDSGPGLSPEQIDHVFERFYRADGARTRPPEGGLSSGTGLGLAIVAAIVKAHEGTVDVTSRAAGEVDDAGEPAHGVAFRVTLPAAPIEGSDSPEVMAMTGE